VITLNSLLSLIYWPDFPHAQAVISLFRFGVLMHVTRSMFAAHLESKYLSLHKIYLRVGLSQFGQSMPGNMG
jgi:hypothetical protein